MTTQDQAPPGQSWDTYWKGTSDVSAFCGGGVNHPAIHVFWMDYFAAQGAQQNTSRMLDLATGNGAVIDIALAASSMSSKSVTCVDLSPAAIQNVEQRIPGVTGIVADALDIPLADGGFDLVTSQFGVEYAGVDAIYEGARLLNSGGQMVMLLHIKEGSVFKECSDSLAAIQKLRDSGFIPLAQDMFSRGFAAMSGAARKPYDDAGRRLAPAVQKVEEILDEYGEHVAGDTISSLYADVGEIHSNLPKYNDEEVGSWLTTMDEELVEYAQRMSSMTSVALDKKTLDAVCRNLQDAGLSIDNADPLHADNQSAAIAWVLKGTKQ